MEGTPGRDVIRRNSPQRDNVSVFLLGALSVSFPPLSILLEAVFPSSSIECLGFEVN